MSQQAIAVQDENGANQEEPSLAPNGIWMDYDHASYMPALGIYNHVERTDGSDDLDAPDAGINCTQLVLHAKRYDEVTYDQQVNFQPGADNNSFNLVADSDDDVAGVGVHDDVTLLIPGDIIRYGDGWHWAIIQEIEYHNQDRLSEQKHIKLIHSSTVGARWFVQKGETLEIFGNADKYLLRPIMRNNPEE